MMRWMGKRSLGALCSAAARLAVPVHHFVPEGALHDGAKRLVELEVALIVLHLDVVLRLLDDGFGGLCLMPLGLVDGALRPALVIKDRVALFIAIVSQERTAVCCWPLRPCC